ncbi:Chromodomain Y-like protein 2 [Leucoagaricus sp. SymC.cos]|nr:Chromodomain Y-like protein 2 [Leucoagaricus sp. SymC.cos]
MPAVENNIYGKHHVELPPTLMSGEEEYKIEAILNHRHCRTCSRRYLEYLIHWSGYGVTKDSWEPESNLENSNEILLEYKRLYRLSQHSPSSITQLIEETKGATTPTTHSKLLPAQSFKNENSNSSLDSLSTKSATSSHPNSASLTTTLENQPSEIMTSPDLHAIF